jgi:pyridoxal phosphate enzyme (YggS family)
MFIGFTVHYGKNGQSKNRTGCPERETDSSGNNGRGSKGVSVLEEKISTDCSKESRIPGSYYNVSELTPKNIAKLLDELPDGVEVVAAAKTRTPEEVLEVVQVGIKIIGENYVKEAKEAYELVGKRAKWHFIGNLQKHNVRRKVLEIFDMIETVDSLEIAKEIDRKCAQIDKIMPILIEVNSGKEPQKSGVLPEDVEQLVREISGFKNVKVMGLMTMGPRFGNPENSRPYFVETRRIFDKIKGMKLHNVELRYLSMGMTNSYKVALEEGANIIRIGTKIFGERGGSS